jgi:putative ABC transport system permease protein
MPITNFFRITIRRLWRNRLYSAINISGLATGMACALLAFLFVQDEISYDRFHKKAAQLFRITTSFTDPQDGSIHTSGATGQVEGPAFKAEIPEIQDYTRVWVGGDTYNLIGDQKALAVHSLYVDDNFFRVFSFPLLYGDSANALTGIHSVVLSEKTALRFFGKTDVVGKILKLEEGNGIEPFRITGVAKEVPENSSIQFEALLPFGYLQTMFRDKNWLNSYLSTFVLLHPGADLQKVEQKFSHTFQANAADQLREAKLSQHQFKFGLQAITGIHFGIFENNSSGTVEKDGTLSGHGGETTLTYSYLLMGIVAFILVMVCVNFLNLSIADSLKRSKEIGVRKISGATASQITRRFLAESAVVCGISFILAIVLTELILPIFNQLARKTIRFSFLSDPIFLLYGLVLMLVCIVLASLYPAIRLSLFNPAEVLYNKQKLNGRNYLRKSLIVLQFTFAVGLVMASIVYYRQMSFITQYNPGYTASDIVEVGLPPQRVNQKVVDHLRTECARDPSIIQVGFGEMGPEDGAQVNLNGTQIKIALSNIDQYFIPTLEIPIKEGRNFSTDFASDSSQSVIVNETFVKETALKDPIGKQIALTYRGSINQPRTIVGVVEDFHYASLKEKINPLVLEIGQSESIWIKLKAGRASQALSAIQKAFREIFPDHYYEYAFLTEENASLYENEQRWKLIVSYAAVLAILICGIGLFGLTHFATQQRIREIGIRKVLGASVARIVSLLSKEFFQLVLLAIVIASPLAWYSMNKWLENFAYRIAITWWMVAIAAAIGMLIALITVTFLAVKAALANPVNSLRTE